MIIAAFIATLNIRNALNRKCLINGDGAERYHRDAKLTSGWEGLGDALGQRRVLGTIVSWLSSYTTGQARGFPSN